jgi:hypothetical protein
LFYYWKWLVFLAAQKEVERMAGDRLVGEGSEPEGGLKSQKRGTGDERRFVIEQGRAWLARPYRPDADLPAGADVAGEGEAPGDGLLPGSGAAPMLRVQAKPREVEVRDLKAERAGRVFPCLEEAGARYTGCVGYDACKVLCWSPRPREREALMRVEKPTGGQCRDCVYAREVRGEVAVLNGRQVRLMECRLGYWHGRTTVHDFALNKIALNVRLPCPGYTEVEEPHPAVERLRRAARLRKGRVAREDEEPEEQEEPEGRA